MTLEDEFSAAVRKHFADIEPLLDGELALVRKQRFPKDVAFLLVEYDSPHFGDDFSVSLWPMDASGKLAGEGHWFLKGQVTTVPAEVYDDERYDAIDPWSTASELVELWFGQRWRKIVGNRLPAFMAHHDSYSKTDLSDGSRANWDEILARFEDR